MINIKPYQNNQFDMIKSWWKKATNLEPIPGMLVEDGSFILEINEVPALCLTTLLTQSKEIAYIFGFIKNPNFKHTSLEECGKILWNHCEDYAKSKGYKRLLCFSDNEKLQTKYQRFGYTPTMKNLVSFVKEVK